MSDIRTDNDFMISGNTRGLAPIRPVVVRTRQQAYRTAAWLKNLAESLPDEDPASTFDEVDQAVQST